jgi:hypothetical protein
VLVSRKLGILLTGWIRCSQRQVGNLTPARLMAWLRLSWVQVLQVSALANPRPTMLTRSLVRTHPSTLCGSRPDDSCHSNLERCLCSYRPPRLHLLTTYIRILFPPPCMPPRRLLVHCHYQGWKLRRPRHSRAFDTLDSEGARETVAEGPTTGLNAGLAGTRKECVRNE